MTTTSEEPTTETGYTGASTGRVTAANGIDYAYRDLGKSEVPLVLLQHFRGNLDNWDPALVDALAAERRVIAFDNVGVGGKLFVVLEEKAVCRIGIDLDPRVREEPCQ